jgi:putative protease
MELSFSRGFAPGWLDGCNHKRLVPGLSSNKRGVPVGTVSGVVGERIQVDLQQGLKKGDGIVIAGDRASGQEIGGRIYQIYQDRRRCEDRVSGRVQIELQAGVVPKSADLAGRTLFLSHSPEHSKKWQTRSIASNEPGKRPLDIAVHAVVGQPIMIKVQQSEIAFELAGEQPLELARKHAITPEQLEQQFSRLGGTPFYLRQVSAHIDGQPMVPLSLLGELRRRMLQRLEQDVDFVVAHACKPEIVWQGMVQSSAASAPESPVADTSPQLHVLCRSLPQIEQVLKQGVRDLYAEFHDIRQYEDAVQAAHQSGAKIALAPLRIQKPGEMGLMKALLKRGADAWLIRNLATLQFARENNVPMIGDFSLNVTNPITAGWYLSKDLRRITASYDLNRDQLTDLVQWLPVEHVEVVIHQHMPMFHMEHCVFCTVLSPGTNKSNCGRPCDRHLVHLRDRVGTEHFLDADIGCRNTLYNGRAQSGAEAVPGLVERGIRHFRIELLPTATASEIQMLITLYRQLIEGRLAATNVWQQLRADNRIGVTRGTLEQKRNPLAIL